LGSRHDSQERYAKERQFHDALVGEKQSRAAGRFYAINASSWSFYRRLLIEEAGCAKERGAGRILEYGSGAGSYSSIALAEAGYACIGVDLSEASVRAATERAAREFPDGLLDYRVMNAEALEFEDQSFELVCGNGILHHLDLERAYREVARVLSPTGVALFTEPVGHNPLINLYRRLTPDQRTADEHPLRAGDLRRAEWYFHDVESWNFHLLALGAVPFRRTRVFKPLLSGLDRVDRFLLKYVPASRRYSWLMVIRLSRPGGRASNDEERAES
jgi:SAM-dependent methyltransferase